MGSILGGRILLVEARVMRGANLVVPRSEVLIYSCDKYFKVDSRGSVDVGLR